MSKKTIKLNKNPLAKLSVSLIIILILGFVLSACNISGLGGSTKTTGVELSLSNLTLNVGDVYQIPDGSVTITPSNSVQTDYYFTTDDTNVISVANKTIKAMGEGSAKLIVNVADTDFTASCTVTVKYKEIEEVKIDALSGVIQDASSPQKAIFIADFFDAIDTGYTQVWTLKSPSGSKKVTELKSSEEFYFLPTENVSGEYEVTLEIKNSLGYIKDKNNTNITDSVKVYVYKNYQLPSSYSQNNDTYVIDDLVVGGDNPAPFIEWKVDGDTLSTSSEYVFNKSGGGEYELELYVNEQKIGSSTTIKQIGSQTPYNVKFDYDNCYPKLNLTWDNNDNNSTSFSVVVFKGQTILENITTNVGQKSIDLSSYQSIASDIFSSELSIKVKSVGDGLSDINANKIYTESDYSEELVVNKLDTNAKTYLTSRLFTNVYYNKYIIDDIEFAQMFLYANMYTPRTTIQPGTETQKETTLKVYLAYVDANIKQKAFATIIDSAFAEGMTTGLYGYSYTFAKNILDITIFYGANNLPTTETTGVANLYGDTKYKNYNFSHNGEVIPYTKDNPKVASDLTFPIEDITKTTQVKTSEQLYIAIESGFRPVPVVKSDAETFYNYAKDVLNHIIDEDMSDVEIAYAIYQWIMWQVTYDYKTLNVGSSDSDEVSIQKGVMYNAYYLEGVFNNTRSFAVCDGMSKAYTIMANMMGLPCYRIAGVAGADASNANTLGGHAWNKVFVDGNWYVVDCTWGDQVNETTYIATTNYSENGFSKYFLVTDYEISGTHVEDTPNNYPRTATTPYNFHSKMLLKGIEGTRDMYLNATNDEDFKTEVEDVVDTIVEYVAVNTKNNKNTYTIGSNLSSTNKSKLLAKTTSSDYIAIDIKVSARNYSKFVKNNTLIDNYLDECLEEKVGSYNSGAYFYLGFEYNGYLYFDLYIYVG